MSRRIFYDRNHGCRDVAKRLSSSQREKIIIDGNYRHDAIIELPIDPNSECNWTREPRPVYLTLRVIPLE